jgi:hypothetical protein
MLWMGNVRADWSSVFVKSLFVGGTAHQPSTPVQVEVAVRRNAFRVSPDTPSVGFALVTFTTPEAANEALTRLHDKPVPDTDATFNLRLHASTLRSEHKHRNGVSLQAQLAPLDAAEIRRRLELFKTPSDPIAEREVRDSGGNGALRLWLLRRLTCVHGNSGIGENTLKMSPPQIPRTKTRAFPEVTTLSLPPDVIAKCLSVLRTTQWPRVSDREGVHCSSYVSLSSLPNPNARRKRRNKKYATLWRAAFEVLASVCGTHTASMFDGLAVTRNVKGSPHIDGLDVAAQFVASFGDFSSGDGKEDGDSGGMLCVETSPASVCVIDTRNAVAAIDGRFVHWVDPSYVGERFSLVWYKRNRDVKEWEVPTNAVHEKFWDADQWRAVEKETPSAKSWVHAGARDLEREAGNELEL